MLYTHYDYLELPPGASTTRVEAAYRTLKQRLNGDADEAMVRLIHEAYAVLSDSKRRQGYDEALQRAAAEADAELKATLDEKGAKVTRHVQAVPAPLIAGPPDAGGAAGPHRPTHLRPSRYRSPRDHALSLHARCRARRARSWPFMLLSATVRPPTPLGCTTHTASRTDRRQVMRPAGARDHFHVRFQPRG